MIKKILRSLMVAILVLLIAGLVIAQATSIAVGDVVTGTAAGADVSYTISIDSGETVVIALESTDFDTLVRVADSSGNELGNDDDSGGNLNSELAFTAPINDTFTITVTSFLGDPTGSFTLSVTGSTGGGGSSSGGGDIQVGDTITDSATENMNYSIFLDSGQQVTINLESSDFDTFLEVQDSSGSTLATDDDSAGNLNSRLEFTAPSSGSYTLVVRSFGGGPSGQFTLSVAAMSQSTSGGTGDISVGDSITATATENMNYEIVLESGQTVLVTLESADFDAFLEIQDNLGSTLESDDDSAGNLNARLEFTAPSSGTYILIVRSFGGSAAGEFTLSVAAASGGGMDSSDLHVGDSITDTTTENVSYSIALDEGQTVSITLEATDFDAFLEIQDSSGASLATDDDSAGDLNAHLDFTAPSSGTYTVIVRSFGGSASGAYTISVEGSEPVAGQELTMEYGQTIDVDPGGAVTTTVHFTAAADDIINLYAISSGDEDSRLYLYDADGNEIIQDDDGGQGSNPFIRALVIPESGTYTAEIQGYGESPLNSSISITLERTELVTITADGVVVTLGPDSGDKDVLTADVVAGTKYMFSVDTATDIESSMYANLVQDGESFASTRFMVSGSSSFAGLFEADQTGAIRIEIEYYGYSNDVDFTISLEPVK